jgi:hypothetical protein
MKNTDSHFWVSDIVKRLPVELLPENPSWSALLSAVTKLKTERNNALCESERLRKAILETIEENLHLADGEVCTLIKLKRAINYDDNAPLTDEQLAFQRWCD